MKIDPILRKAILMEASDVHLVAGLAPAVRSGGEILAMEGDALGAEELRELLYELLGPERRAAFERDKRACFSTLFEDAAHIRVSLYYRLGRVEAAIRLRSMELRPLEELGLPESVARMTEHPNGLVLITGPTGVGKTTTLYSMIDRINRERRKKIVTVEDPVEYLHGHKRSMVVQQEIGKDAAGFHEALMHILRMDPDVICIGEMRDGETIRAALLAAETGHLVIATLHTTGAAQTVERIVTAVGAEERSAVGVQLANTLRGAVSQLLLPTVGGKARALAYEVMVGNPAVRANIREGNLPGLNLAIQSGAGAGMVALDSRLRELYEGALISYDTAISFARDPNMILDRRGAKRAAAAVR